MAGAKATNRPMRDGPPWPTKAEVREALATEGTIREAIWKLRVTRNRFYEILGDSTTGHHLSEEHRRKISAGGQEDGGGETRMERDPGTFTDSARPLERARPRQSGTSFAYHS
jgi:hypothetical protein